MGGKVGWPIGPRPSSVDGVLVALATCPLSPGSLQLLPLPLSHMAMQPNVKVSIPLTLLFLSAGDVFFSPVHLADNLSNFKARCEFHLFCAALQSSAETPSGLTSRKWHHSSTTNPGACA